MRKNSDQFSNPLVIIWGAGRHPFEEGKTFNIYIFMVLT